MLDTLDQTTQLIEPVHTSFSERELRLCCVFELVFLLDILCLANYRLWLKQSISNVVEQIRKQFARKKALKYLQESLGAVEFLGEGQPCFMRYRVRLNPNSRA
jgi:hypothetical protein